MNKELISKMIEHSKEASGNSYCPNSNTPEGASLLVDGNVIVGGCSVEYAFETISAGEVALAKAFSEGLTGFKAICLWSKKILPYPNARFLQMAAEFNPDLDIIVANNDTYSIHKLHQMLPFRRIYSEEN